MLKKIVAVLMLAFGFTYAQAQMFLATLPVEVTTAITDVEAGWDLVYPLMITIGLTLLVWGLIKKGVRRA